MRELYEQLLIYIRGIWRYRWLRLIKPHLQLIFCQRLYFGRHRWRVVSNFGLAIERLICGRIHDRASAEGALADADIALSAKSILLNPDWVAHVREGRRLPLHASAEADVAYTETPLLLNLSAQGFSLVAINATRDCSAA